MDVYITEKESGTRRALSMLPEKVKITAGADFRSYDIINLGEAKIPNGTKLLQFSWSGTFPGGRRKGYRFIKAQHWRPPPEMQRIFTRWMENGTVLNLMVTETWINHEVLLSAFNATPKGGCADVDYDVTFIQNREIRIYTTAELNMGLADDLTDTSGELDGDRADPPLLAQIAPAGTYTVQAGDTLWSIAQRFSGNGGGYAYLYSINQDVIGPSSDSIQPGMVLTLPW